MKTALKVICIILASILIITIGFLIYCLSITKEAKLDTNKLINMEKTISFYDSNNNFLFTEGEDKKVTEICDIPSHVQNAFIAVEDKRFYSHKGVDYKGLLRAMISNIKSLSFKEGGSTISQQLIKNTHLSNDKTFKRKLIEIKLAKQLEKTYSKKQILEKYLNTIYFGDNCYGITSASMHYFDKEPKDLTINEGAFLAGIIKAPSNYSPFKNIEKCNDRKNVVLSQMLKEKYIDNEEYNQYITTDVKPVEQETNNLDYGYNYLVRKELNNIIKDYPFSTGNLKVYTTYDENVQSVIDIALNNDKTECDKSAIIIDIDGKIKGYRSTCGDIFRQVGSTIKPVLVYAPAIENNIVYSCSPILDEKINYSGYSPSNYNDKYYGYVSVKESLSKSLNSCAVKLLNYTGVEKSKSYLKKMNFPFSKNDNSLCIALGATENGARLSTLTSLYTVFLNEGNFALPHTITKVESQNNGIIYQINENKSRIFNEETVHIVSDMLEKTVKSGTAKKLSFINLPLCSKTGTVGNEKGNFDAYNISYNSEQILGVWYGNKDNSLMDNSITGGTKPTALASSIWSDLYQNKDIPISYKKSDNVCELNVDKIELDEGKNVLLASDISPNRFVIKALFNKNNLPKKSSRFTAPILSNTKITLDGMDVKIILDTPEYLNAYIYRLSSDKKELVYDTKNKDKNLFIDKNLASSTEYSYIVVPYYEFSGEIILGEEKEVGKIKTPNIDINNWWNDDFE